MQHRKYELDRLHNRLTVRGDLVATTALRIGAGRSTTIIGSDLPVLRDALDKPFIPGASLKGSLRAQVESLVCAVAPEQILDFKLLERRTRELRNEKQKWALGNEQQNQDERFNREVWEKVGMIDVTFGSLEIAGRLFFKDALVDEQIWFGQFEVRNGVAINRDTETAENQHLYDYEVVPAGTRFNFQLTMENAQDWQLGMVLWALKPWQAGNIQIGGFRSRGLGYVKLEEANYSYVAIQQDKPSVDDVLQLWNVDSRETHTLSAEDARIPDWKAAFRNELINPTLKGYPDA
ncbi:MAG: CRISPR-associated RAMP protein [Chloroflexi bacterium AL-W]|nr:CRISPR-associated RAMP protein [Chloroflexi bacterium AL-N1]NOK65541.1 CRISPR-associated RAMP protein [Chloroflexi bacterium AL-N10]NOK74517.1 CRISPR-associated RAMP protein [Chloroflexi bacterium AL-N5]NOK80574.1 CRISPR-associated RAMP protein [Chloroflexi bacterium AL-W]NOK88775.1 CRISPR-associated RAMP protein [Chloroflexi bacterium AL-N15]